MMRWNKKLLTTRYLVVIGLLLGSMGCYWEGVRVEVVEGLLVLSPGGLLGTAGLLYCLLLLARDFFVVPNMLLPAIMLSQIPEWLQEMQAIKRDFMAFNRDCASTPHILTSDGVALDAVAWENRAAPPSKGRWVVWLCANGFCYESMLPFLQHYALALDASFLAFAYRAVGDSQLVLPADFSDLVLDARAVLDHLYARGVAPDRILLHGHSLGGAVAAAASSACASFSGPLVNDRSFSSLSPVAVELFLSGQPQFCRFLSLVIGGALALPLAAFFSFGFLLSIITAPIAAFSFASFTARHPAPLRALVPAFFLLIGWHPDVASFWSRLPAGRRSLVITHRHDAVIRWSCSLWNALTPPVRSRSRLFELPADPRFSGNYHGAMLSDFAASWPHLVTAVSELFPS